MVIRIHDAARWSRVKAGESLVLRGEKGRKIRLEVNCPQPTSFEFVQGDEGREAATFLAVVQGLEVIEFYSDGPGEVFATTGDDWWVATSEGDEVGFESDAPSYVKIAQRKARNPELELMMLKVEQNIQRRLDKQAAEVEELLAARAAAAEAQGADPETGELGEDENDPGATDGAAGEGDPEGSAVQAAGKAKGAKADGASPA